MNGPTSKKQVPEKLRASTMENTLLQQVIHTQEHIHLCNKDFYAHPTGALIWPAEETLIIADTYLRSGYVLNALMAGSNKSFATEIIKSIETLITTNNIKQVIAVGRVFRRIDDTYHLDANDLTMLYEIQKKVDWVWVAGQMARQLPNLVGGIRAAHFSHADIHFCATPSKSIVTNEIAAGMYPMARTEPINYNPITNEELSDEGTNPCFVSNGKRLLMPAFGGKLGAKNILGDEFLPLFGYDDLMIQAVDSYKTYPVPHHTLLAG